MEPICCHYYHCYNNPLPSIFNTNILFPSKQAATLSPSPLTLSFRFPNNRNRRRRAERIFVCYLSDRGEHASGVVNDVTRHEQGQEEEEEVEVEVMKLENNVRRMKASINIRASLFNIWNLLTDYQRLSDFIPALQLSHVIDQQPKFARLLQIGVQELAFGLTFNAKGTIDCYERDLEILTCSSALKRDIDFNMIEGDFVLFQGKWSILQLNRDDEDFSTTLSYLVEVKPKPWLPVGLVEGRLCKEIRANLKCIRDEAERAEATQEFLDASS